MTIQKSENRNLLGTRGTGAHRPGRQYWIVAGGQIIGICTAVQCWLTQQQATLSDIPRRTHQPAGTGFSTVTWEGPGFCCYFWPFVFGRLTKG